MLSSATGRDRVQGPPLAAASALQDLVPDDPANRPIALFLLLLRLRGRRGLRLGEPLRIVMGVDGCPPGPFGGAGRGVHGWSRELAALGNEVGVLAGQVAEMRVEVF